MKIQQKLNPVVQGKRFVGFLSNKYYGLMAVCMTALAMPDVAHAESDAAKKVTGILDDLTAIGKAIYRFFPVLIILAGAYAAYWGIMEFMKGVKTDNREGNKTKGAIVFLVGVIAMAWTYVMSDIAGIVTQGQSGGMKGVNDVDIGL